MAFFHAFIQAQAIGKAAHNTAQVANSQGLANSWSAIGLYIAMSAAHSKAQTVALARVGEYLVTNGHHNLLSIAHFQAKPSQAASANSVVAFVALYNPEFVLASTDLEILLSSRYCLKSFTK
jgi:hypothetical protein